MSLIVIILLCIAVILAGAFLGKPGGYVVLGLGLLALLLAMFGGVGFHIGR